MKKYVAGLEKKVTVEEKCFRVEKNVARTKPAPALVASDRSVRSDARSPDRSFLLLAARPGAPNSVLAPSSGARSPYLLLVTKEGATALTFARLRRHGAVPSPQSMELAGDINSFMSVSGLF